MKGKMFLTIAIGALGAIFTGCNNDNGVDCPQDHTGPLAENEEKLTGEWVLSAIVSEEEIDLTDDDEENPEQDIYAQYSDCLQDGVYTFAADRKYTFEQGQNAADCENKSSLEGTWQLSAQTLSLIGGCNVQNVAITFNGDASAFSFTDDYNVRDANGQTVSTEITFTYTAAAS